MTPPVVCVDVIAVKAPVGLCAQIRCKECRNSQVVARQSMDDHWQAARASEQRGKASIRIPSRRLLLLNLNAKAAAAQHTNKERINEPALVQGLQLRESLTGIASHRMSCRLVSGPIAVRHRRDRDQTSSSQPPPALEVAYGTAALPCHAHHRSLPPRGRGSQGGEGDRDLGGKRYRSEAAPEQQ
jgi:hypothetical protein